MPTTRLRFGAFLTQSRHLPADRIDARQAANGGRGPAFPSDPDLGGKVLAHGTSALMALETRD
jgi:hypothetical protein